MKRVKIGILGGGEVASHLIAFIKEQPLIEIVAVFVRDINKPRHFDRFNMDIKKTTVLEEVTSNNEIDIVIDCLPGKELPQKALLQAVVHNRDIISCGKELWDDKDYSDIIITKAQEQGSTIWLNSIVANYAYQYDLIPENLTHLTIRQYESYGLYADRYAGALQTAAFILKDILSIVNINGGAQ